MIEYLFWRLKIYAIIETSGKQYRVTPGQTVDVDRLDAAAGETVELDRVLLIGDDDKVTVGNPVVDGGKVVATVKEQRRGDKIIVFKFKAKTRYRRKLGHRQFLTRLSIDRIDRPGKSEARPAAKAETSQKEETADGT